MPSAIHNPQQHLRLTILPLYSMLAHMIDQISSQSSRVQSGLDCLLDDPNLLTGQRVGLVTNASAVTCTAVPAVQALAPVCTLVALFAPEHGLATHAPDGVPVPFAVDPQTGLPVYSLYGENKEPTAAAVQDVNLLLFDIQDIGARFYTYIWTLSHVLEAAARFHLPVVILDRPNPVNGLVCEGPLLHPDYHSFVGRGPLPVRHGMTVGELGHLFTDAFNLNVDLTVIKMADWQRRMWFDDTGLPWVPTSPAMPKLETATVYPGTCLLEGTNLSEGRGTATPFECMGAPWVDGPRLADALNELRLPGVRFRPTSFTPSASKHKGETCHGVYLHVMDRRSFAPLQTGLHILSTLVQLWPKDFCWLGTSWEGRHPHFDLLIGNGWVRDRLDKGAPVSEIVAHWKEELLQFSSQRQRYSLYRE
jgi:uncharacterized protein YbbC (DUF1343 family)